MTMVAIQQRKVNAKYLSGLVITPRHRPGLLRDRRAFLIRNALGLGITACLLRLSSRLRAQGKAHRHGGAACDGFELLLQVAAHPEPDFFGLGDYHLRVVVSAYAAARYPIDE
ncbi:MAG: hypothetical protein ACLVDB_02740 [Anaeromassilibacillus sp.]